MPRVPVNSKVILGNREVDQRRDYANYVYQERIKNVDARHKNDVLKLYLPYVNSVWNKCPSEIEVVRHCVCSIILTLFKITSPK